MRAIDFREISLSPGMTIAYAIFATVMPITKL